MTSCSHVSLSCIPILGVLEQRWVDVCRSFILVCGFSNLTLVRSGPHIVQYASGNSRLFLQDFLLVGILPLPTSSAGFLAPEILCVPLITQAYAC